VFHTVLQDYNADGSVDASLSDLALGHTLFENLGDGTFSEVASFAGGVGIAPVRVQLLLDIDRDGDDDLLLGGAAIGISSHLFLTNADGTLTEITDASGLPDLPLTALAATDLDNDGDIDIVAATNSFPALTTTLLLRNNGNNTFTDITSSSNLPSQLLPRQLGKIVLIDYDNDGDSDLLNSHSTPGRSMSLFRNDGNLEFTDVTAQSFPGGVRDRSSTLAAGDYDNDGDLDLFASHVVDCAAKPVVTESSLYRNNGDGTFTDVIASTGELGGTSITSAFWGSEFFDFDNDGDLDLYISKDSTCPALEGLVTAKFQVLFENNGDGTFSRVNNLAFPPDTGSTLATAGFGDYDSDGAFDIYAPGTALAGGKGGLLRNVVNSGNNWIHVELEGDTSNRDAYGARVIVKTNGGSQIREVHSSAVDATTAHFGLGSSGMIDSIEVRWPSGIVQRLENVAVNQQLLIVECQDSDGDGACNEVDNCAMDANPDQSDIDGDGLGDPCDLDMDGDGVENTSDICIERANPEQWDRDHDGCGNVCDGDFDQSGRVDVGDYDDLLRHFGDTWQQIPTEHELDNPAVSPVGYSDLAVFFELLFEVPVPGPSGTTRGTTACPAQ
jgi:hypothetical protein